jgi:hypothetical protein
MLEPCDGKLSSTVFRGERSREAPALPGVELFAKILEVNMYLRKVTLILIISIIASFSIRTFGTVFPQVFKDVLVVKATILINAIFILSHLIFWLCFYQEYISLKKTSLKKICVLAIIGSFAVSMIYIKKIPFVLGLKVQFPLFFLNPYYDALVPIISSVFHLILFLALAKNLDKTEKFRLRNPIRSIIIGISIYICLHLIVLINFIATHRSEWVEHMSRVVAVGTVPVIISAVLFMLYFYYQFYRFLDSRENIERVPT